jgi:hypothetical protein
MIHLSIAPHDRFRISGYTGQYYGEVCGTGDGHAISFRQLHVVTCPRCLEMAKQWRIRGDYI